MSEENPQESVSTPEEPRKKSWVRRIWRVIYRGVIYSFLFLLTIILILGTLIQFSFFQTWLARYGTDYLSRNTGFRVDIESVYINLLESELTLNKLHVHDPKNRTLIYAEKVYADFEYASIVKNGDFHLQALELYKTSANLTVDKKTEQLNINDWIASLATLFEKKNENPSSEPSLVKFDRVKISESYFGYTDETRPFDMSDRIDFAHFGVDELYGELENFRIISDTIESQINTLQGIESKTQLKIHHLGAFFRMTDQSMDFRKLLCEVGESVIKDELFLKFAHRRDLSEFVEKVTIIAYLDSSVIHTKDLAFFAPEVKQFEDTWHVSGLFRGRVNDFSLKNLDLAWGNYSRVKGDASFEGLPDIENTFMQFNFQESSIDPKELQVYLRQPNISEVLERFGQMNFKAEFVGFINDFVANGNFNTGLGNFVSNINLKIRPNSNQSYYKGEVTTQSFDLGKLLALPQLGKVSIQGNIEGTGFDPDYAQLEMDAKLNEFYFNQYLYKGIEVNGKLSKKHFEGTLESNDANFDLSLDGELDYNAKSENKDTPAGRFDLTAQVRNINLQALHFIDRNLILSGDLHLDTYGLSLDSLTGEASLNNMNLVLDQDSLFMNNLELITFKTFEGGRFFTLDSDFFTFNADGKFIFSEVFSNLQTLVDEYILIFQNYPDKIAEYYEAKKKADISSYNFNFDLDVKNINPILKLFEDPKNIHISPDFRFTGSFSQEEITRFELYSDKPIDTLYYKGTNFFDSELNISTSKTVYTPLLFADLNIVSQKQNFAGTATENLLASATWGDNLIEFLLKAQQPNSTNKADFAGTIQFLKDSTQIEFSKADLKFLDEDWSISPNNQISIKPHLIAFKDILLKNNAYTSSQITLKGILSDTLTDQPLSINIQDVELYPLASFFGRDVRGLLNADIELLDLYNQFKLNSTTNLENLLIDKILIGDLDGKVDWKAEDKKLAVDAKIYRKGQYILDLAGDYFPDNLKNSLDLRADFNRTNLEIAEPFVSFLFSGLSGTATGVLDIKGTLEEPVITGSLNIPNGRLRINYPNTTYDLSGKVNFTPNQISAQSLSLYDELGNRARLGLDVFLDNFNEPSLDLNARFFNFQLLNTTAEDNSLFYGTAYATGSLAINGLLDRLNLNVNARSEKGTKISLPLDGYEEVAQKEFIQFVQPGQLMLDSGFVQKVELGGLNLSFNLEIDQNAEFEIIFDKKAGDIIRGRGKGLIDLGVNPEGDVSLFGYYIIEKGQYNFTFANLVNKAFDIRPGSRVTFNGDMFDTQLDVYAIYKKNIPLSPLVDMNNVPDPENGEYRRPFEVSAVLELKGKLLAPEIKLDLDLSEAKRTSNINLQTAIYQLDTQVKNDEQERSRQVFSLLILNRLSPPNSFRGGGVAGTAGSSLSEMLSNQFSNWISQVDENLELRFDVDASNLNNFQLRVSYNLLDGRLRITRDGGFINNQNQADFASVVGDWTVEYLLSPGGKYRIKMYHRSNQNLVNNLNNSTSTAGVSFVHTASFNKVGELFSSNKNAKEDRKSRTRIKNESEELITDEPVVSSDTLSNPANNQENPSNTERMPLKKRGFDLPNSNSKNLDIVMEKSSNSDKKNTQKKPNQKIPTKEKEVFPLEHRFAAPPKVNPSATLSP